MGDDKAQDDSDESYAAFVEWLQKKTVEELRQGKGDQNAIKAAIAKYLEIGNHAHLTPMELWDFFSISTPGIVDKAGFAEKEIDETIELFDEVSTEYYARFFPDE